MAENTDHLLTEVIANLQSKYEGFLQELNRLQEEKIALEKTQLIYAAAYWRPGKTQDQRYLYLNYPLQKGQPRRRVYVGSDPKKIRQAELAIERAKKYEILSKRIHSVESCAKQAAHHINSAIELLKTDI